MGELVAGSDIVFHQAALRITHCAAEPRLGARGDGRRHLQPARSLRLSRRRAGRGGLLGLDLRHGRRGSRRDEDHHPYDNRTCTAREAVQRRACCAPFNDMHGLDYVALRYFNVYGPRMDLHGRYTEVLVRWMERIDAGLPPVIFGDGSQTMDFVHVHDVARANLCAPPGRRVRRRAQRRQRHRDQPASTGRTPRRGDGPTRPRARARAGAGGQPGAAAAGRHRRPPSELLGFVSSVPLEQGLRDLVAWWRANRAAAAVLAGQAA